jgi:hypothetical protein
MIKKIFVLVGVGFFIGSSAEKDISPAVAVQVNDGFERVIARLRRGDNDRQFQALADLNYFVQHVPARRFAIVQIARGFLRNPSPGLRLAALDLLYDLMQYGREYRLAAIAAVQRLKQWNEQDRDVLNLMARIEVFE